MRTLVIGISLIILYLSDLLIGRAPESRDGLCELRRNQANKKKQLKNAFRRLSRTFP